MKKMSKHALQSRKLIAQQAAKWMADHGIQDFESAKRRALRNLGITHCNPNLLPSHQEVQEALIAQQRLFIDPNRENHLRTLREKAYRTMLMLKDFNPLLTGMVLDGSATMHAHITLHVFANTPEEVMIHLINYDIPHEALENRLQLRDRQFKMFPAFRFYLAGTLIDAIVLPENSLKFQVRCPIYGENMPRASIQAVKSLLGLVEDP